MESTVEHIVRLREAIIQATFLPAMWEDAKRELVIAQYVTAAVLRELVTSSLSVDVTQRSP